MPVTVIDHPLAQDLLTKLRVQTTTHVEYKNLSHRLALLIAMQATNDLSVTRTSVKTPIQQANGYVIAEPLILVPILRAGLSLLPPLQELFPEAKTGFIGLQRINDGLNTEQYYFNVPQDPNATVLIMDPMIATAGSACRAIHDLLNLKFRKIKLLSFLSAPEGLHLLESKYPEIQIYTAAIDERLDKNNYIIPGLGDFGDRLFGTQHN